MSRAILVSINGVVMQSPADFKVMNGHRVVFKNPPNNGDTVQFTTDTNGSLKTANYFGTGTRTAFNLPAWPRVRFEVVTNSKESVPEGYTVVDVDNEIDNWIRDNCSTHEWKWADQLDGDPSTQFGMNRLIVKDTVLTYIATKWA